MLKLYLIKYYKLFLKKVDEKKDSDDLDIEDLLKDNKKWEDIGFFNKLKLFNYWIFVAIIGSIV